MWQKPGGWGKTLVRNGPPTEMTWRTRAGQWQMLSKVVKTTTHRTQGKRSKSLAGLEEGCTKKNRLKPQEGFAHV